MNTYDAPDISAHEFMLAIMHDPSVDLGLRIRAADELCHAGLGDIGAVRVLKVIIKSGFITDEEMQEVALLQRIWASGQTLTSLGWDGSPGLRYIRDILADIPIKGHA